MSFLNGYVLGYAGVWALGLALLAVVFVGRRAIAWRRRRKVQKFVNAWAKANERDLVGALCDLAVFGSAQLEVDEASGKVKAVPLAKPYTRADWIRDVYDPNLTREQLMERFVRIERPAKKCVLCDGEYLDGGACHGAAKSVSQQSRDLDALDHRYGSVCSRMECKRAECVKATAVRSDQVLNEYTDASGVVGVDKAKGNDYYTVRVSCVASSSAGAVTITGVELVTDEAEPKTEKCEYCHVEYLAPVGAHHDYVECARNVTEAGKPKFRVGQWVRQKTTGELFEVTATSDWNGGAVDFKARDGFGTYVYSEVEPAVPRVGEWWQYKACGKCERAGDGAAWKIYSPCNPNKHCPCAEMVACGCLVPVNFGRGDGGEQTASEHRK